MNDSLTFMDHLVKTPSLDEVDRGENGPFERGTQCVAVKLCYFNF